MFERIKQFINDYATRLHQKIRRFASKNLWYVLAAVAAIFFLAGVAFGGTIAKPPVMDVKPFVTVVLGRCDDGAMAGFSDYDIDGDDDTDFRELTKNGKPVGYVLYVKGVNEPQSFVLLRTDGAWESRTTEEMGGLSVCDLPVKVKVAKDDTKFIVDGIKDSPWSSRRGGMSDGDPGFLTRDPMQF